MGFSLTSPAPEKGDPTAENRVWGFFGDAQQSHRENRPQSLQPRQGNPLTTTKTASGRTYWPSRDPIGERGGLNVYGMVGNDAVGKIDRLGLAVTLPFDGGTPWTSQVPSKEDEDQSEFPADFDFTFENLPRINDLPSSPIPEAPIPVSEEDPHATYRCVRHEKALSSYRGPDGKLIYSNTRVCGDGGSKCPDQCWYWESHSYTCEKIKGPSDGVTPLRFFPIFKKEMCVDSCDGIDSEKSFPKTFEMNLSFAFGRDANDGWYVARGDVNQANPRGAGNAGPGDFELLPE